MGPTVIQSQLAEYKSVNPPDQGSLEQRFRRLPRLQNDRQSELSQQARQAHEFSQKLRETEAEAIHLMQEEVDRTQRMQESAVMSHPSVQELEERIGKESWSAREWDFNVNNERNRIVEQIEGIKETITEKEAMLNDMERQKDTFGRQWEELNEEKSKLENQVNSSTMSEDQVKQRIDQLKNQIGSMEGNVNSLQTHLLEGEKRQHSIDPEIQNIKVELQRLQHQKQVTGNVDHLESEQSSLQNSIEKERDYVNKTKGCIHEADNFLKQHKAIHDALKKEVEYWKGNIDKASSATDLAKNFKSEITNHRERVKQEIASIKGTCGELVGKRETLNEQIRQLMQERDKLEETIYNHDKHVGQLEVQLAQYSEDIAMADQLDQEAHKLCSETENNIRGKGELLDREESLMSECLDKKNQAERTVREAEGRINDLIQRMRELENRINEASGQHGQMQYKIDELQNKHDSLIRERDSCALNLQNIRNKINQLVSQIKPLQDELTTCYHQNRQFFDARTSAQRRLEEVNNRLKQHPTNLSMRISDLQAELTSLKAHLQELEQKLSTSSANPFNAIVESLKFQRSAIEQAARSEILKNPSSELLAQMARETEAVMRAEYASGVASRQHQIEREAGELATLKASSQVNLVLDEQATGRLLNEHGLMGTVPDYRRVASAIVELSEQHHISAH